MFDEPTSGLDLKHMREVARSLKSLADQGKTLLVITHDPELVMAGCSYVVHMGKGQIKESYPLDESGSKRFWIFPNPPVNFEIMNVRAALTGQKDNDKRPLYFGGLLFWGTDSMAQYKEGLCSKNL